MFNFLADELLGFGTELACTQGGHCLLSSVHGSASSVSCCMGGMLGTRALGSSGRPGSGPLECQVYERLQYAKRTPGKVAHTCNPGTQEVEAGGSTVDG